MDWLTPPLHADHPAAQAWQAHVDAGRIGAPPAPMDPANLATIGRWEAVLRAGRLARGDVRYWTTGA